MTRSSAQRRFFMGSFPLIIADQAAQSDVEGRNELPSRSAAWYRMKEWIASDPRAFGREYMLEIIAPTEAEYQAAIRQGKVRSTPRGHIGVDLAKGDDQTVFYIKDDIE